MISVLGNLWTSWKTPFRGRKPKTPVRWMCLLAFEYMALAQSRALDLRKRNEICQAVELGVFLNRWFDKKRSFDRCEYRLLRRDLPLQPTKTYLKELRALENGRPEAGDWRAIYEYRRGVLWVSLQFLFQLAELEPRPILLPLCSLIQLVDDVLDRELDHRLGLPTFLTSGAPSASTLAHKFWRELSKEREVDDMPIVLSGWLVYVFVRSVILVSPVLLSLSRLFLSAERDQL